MRHSPLHRNVYALTCTMVTLAGCSSYFDNLAAPTPTQITNYASEVGSLNVMRNNTSRPMDSSEYLLASINYTNERCDEFFDKLSRFQQDSSFTDKILASAVAAGTPLMTAYEVGAKTVALTAASIAYAQNVNKFASEIYAYAAHAPQLKRHVKDQMAGFLTNVEKDWQKGRLKMEACSAVGGCFNELERMIYVRGRAQAYANICSITNFRAIIESSLANTESRCKAVGPTNSNGTPESSGASTLAGGVSNCEAQPKTQAPQT